MGMRRCSWVPSSQRCRHIPQSQHHKPPEHRWGRWSHSPPQMCHLGRGLHTWAPASQGHSSDSAQCLAGRPPHACTGGTAVHSSHRRYQVGRAGGTGSRSSPARRTYSCLCRQSTAHSARSGRSCGRTAPRSGPRGRAARSAGRGSRAGMRTGPSPRCSGRARTRTAAGTRGPTSPAGRRSDPTPSRTASRGSCSGSCSGGPTSPPRTGSCRWPGHSGLPLGCTGTGGGTWSTTSPPRSGTRRSSGRSAREGCRCTRTRSGCPSGWLGSGTHRCRARTGHGGGRHSSPGSRGPSTGPGSGSCTGPRRSQVCIDRGLASRILRLPGRHRVPHRWLKNTHEVRRTGA